MDRQILDEFSLRCFRLPVINDQIINCKAMTYEFLFRVFGHILVFRDDLTKRKVFSTSRFCEGIKKQIDYLLITFQSVLFWDEPQSLGKMACARRDDWPSYYLFS